MELRARAAGGRAQASWRQRAVPSSTSSRATARPSSERGVPARSRASSATRACFAASSASGRSRRSRALATWRNEPMKAPHRARSAAGGYHHHHHVSTSICIIVASGARPPTPGRARGQAGRFAIARTRGGACSCFRSAAASAVRRRQQARATPVRRGQHGVARGSRRPWMGRTTVQPPNSAETAFVTHPERAQQPAITAAAASREAEAPGSSCGGRRRRRALAIKGRARATPLGTPRRTADGRRAARRRPAIRSGPRLKADAFSKPTSDPATRRCGRAPSPALGGGAPQLRGAAEEVRTALTAAVAPRPRARRLRRTDGHAEPARTPAPARLAGGRANAGASFTSSKRASRPADAARRRRRVGTSAMALADLRR